MMKKMIAVALALACAISVSACQDAAADGHPRRRRDWRRHGRVDRIRGFGRQRRRGHRGRRDRRRRGRADRKRGDASATPLRAMGFRPKRQPRLRGLLPMTRPRAAAHQSAADVRRIGGPNTNKAGE